MKMITVNELTEGLPETRDAMVELKFKLAWDFNGKEYREHWDTLSQDQQMQIVDSCIDFNEELE